MQLNPSQIQDRSSALDKCNLFSLTHCQNGLGFLLSSALFQVCPQSCHFQHPVYPAVTVLSLPASSRPCCKGSFALCFQTDLELKPIQWMMPLLNLLWYEADSACRGREGKRSLPILFSARWAIGRIADCRGNGTSLCSPGTHGPLGHTCTNQFQSITEV